MATATHKGVLMVRGRKTGFVTLAGFDEDILIPPDELGGAFDGDIVELSLTGKNSSGRETGKVTKVIERARTMVVGVVEVENGAPILKPDNHRIHSPFLLLDTSLKSDGMKAVAEILEWKGDAYPTARVVEILGKAGEHETEMQAIIHSGGFAVDFPHDVGAAAEELYKNKDRIFKEAAEDSDRKDIRGTLTFTIDPEDAKDFDDALSYKVLENGNIEVGIHIADVSHYVEEKGAIDKEAAERGTSIYLVDRVIPMLPEVLSNDLCSLRPNEDRLAFSAMFEIGRDGEIHDTWYGKTLIHSDKRFSYEAAQEVLDNQSGEHLEELSELMKISRILREKRYKNGAIAFEQPEVRFKLDEHGKPIDVYAKVRTETMMMIEDYMLLANQSVATFIYNLSKDNERDAAFVYRIHDVPDPEKIEELSTFLNALGYEFKTNSGLVEAKDINKLLKEIEGKPEENLIKVATIRSMAKAVYSTKNIGHFGLAFKFYTHFTSPIRRYPDLMAHRLLLKHLNGSPISGRELARYENLSVQSSQREISAVDAERSSVKFKQVEYMLDKVGQEFDGIVTGVTEWGIYVEDKHSKAEGMVRLSSIKSDFFNYHPKSYSVSGEKTGTKYRLGDEVKIKLTRADLDDRELDFELT